MYIQNNQETLVVKYNELVPLFYKNYNTIQAVVSRSEARGYGMKRVMKGGNCRMALIEYDSLPGKIRSQIPDPRKGVHVLEHFFEIDTEAVQFYQAYRFEKDYRSLSPEHQLLYVATASLLDAIIKLRDVRVRKILESGHAVKNLWQTLCEDANSFLPICVEKYGLKYDIPDNYRRFHDKVKRYEAEKYESIVKGYHTTSNATKVTDAMFGVFESIFATQPNKPTYEDVYQIYTDFVNGKCELINNATGECYKPSDFEAVSKSTVKRYLTKWESQISTWLKRSGDRQKYIQQFVPAHKMDIDIPAGSLLSIDDRQPPFAYKDKERAWAYMGLDVGAHCWTAWVFGKSKDGIIVDFYRQLVRNYHEWGFNLPIELECESSLNSSYKNTFLLPGNMFDYVRIEANRARGKIIERRYGSLRYENEKERDGWLARPFARKESNQKSEENAPTLPYKTIVDNCLKDIEDWNNSKHPIHQDKTRWEVFCEAQSEQTRPINWHGILPYLGYKTKTSCRVGIVRLQNNTYLLGNNGKISVGDELLKLMSLAEGEQLEVCWLDGNDGNVIKAFAYIDNIFICELLPQPVYKRSHADQTDIDLANREIMSKYAITIESYGRRHKNEIEKITVIKAPKELSTKFKIKELHTHEQQNENQEVEILPQNEEEDLILIESSFQKSLKDRFNNKYK